MTRRECGFHRHDLVAHQIVESREHTRVERAAAEPVGAVEQNRPGIGAGEGDDKLCGGPLNERVFKGLDDLVRDQIMAMKTTFTPGHYRRRVAGVLARRLVQRLWDTAP